MYFFATRHDEPEVRLRQAARRLLSVSLHRFEVVAKLLLERSDLFHQPIDRRHEVVLAPSLLAHLGDEVGREDVRHRRQLNDAQMRVVLGYLELVHHVLAEVEIHFRVHQAAILRVGERLGVLLVLQLRRFRVAPLRRTPRDLDAVLVEQRRQPGRVLLVVVDEVLGRLVHGQQPRPLLKQRHGDARRRRRMAVRRDVPFLDRLDVQALFHLPREMLLVVRGQQIDLPDFAQVHAHRVIDTL